VKASTVYFFNDEFYIHTDCKTAAGVWVSYPPIYKVSKESQEELGRAVLTSLQASLDNVPHPTDFKALIAPLLDIAQVKSWNIFAKTALCLGVEKSNASITLIPTKNAGKAGGYIPIQDKRKILQYSTPDELGAAVLLSIEQCE